VRPSRLIQAGVAVLVAALFLVRVRPPEPAAPPAAALPGETTGTADNRVTITMSVWGMPWEDTLFEDYYCRQFERLHPGVRVKYVRLAGDIVSKYMLWHMRGDGSGADVMRQHSSFLHRLVDAGVNEPLDRFVRNPATGITDMEDFVPQLTQLCTIAGSLRAIPADMNQMGLIYNKDIFDDYNRRHPDAPLPYPQPDWTWGDMEDAAGKLTVRRGSHTEVFGLDFHRAAYLFLCFHAQAGGRVWTDDGNRTLIDSPEALDVVRFWRKMATEMQVARPDSLRDTAMGPDKFFEFGKTAMLIDGSWRLPDIMKQAPSVRFGVVSLPSHRRRVTIGGMTCWAMSADSRNKQAAWELIRFLSSKEGSLKYWDTLWVAPPSRRSVVFDERFKSTSGVTVNGVALTPALRRGDFADKAAWLLDGFRDDPATSQPRVTLEYASRYYETLAARLQVALDRIFLPDSRFDPAEELRKCAADVNTEIEQQRRSVAAPRAKGTD
jgi:multiple sugar transport system substrate-binding protein